MLLGCAKVLYSRSSNRESLYFVLKNLALRAKSEIDGFATLFKETLSFDFRKRLWLRGSYRFSCDGFRIKPQPMNEIRNESRNRITKDETTPLG